MSAVEANTNQSLHAEDGSSDGFVAWDTLHDMPAWGISLAVHIVILIVFMSITFVIETQADLLLTSEVDLPELEKEFVYKTEVLEEMGSDSPMNIAGPSMAAAQDAGIDNHIEQEESITEELIDPRIPKVEALMTPNEADLMQTVDLTGTTEHAGGTEGAVDRVAQEIASSLRQRKTLVVWLMDESLSMEKRREKIAERFEHIYEQIGGLDVGAEEALRSAIVGYGKEIHVLQEEPTNDMDELRKAVASIKNDVSGEERVFAAINETLKVFVPHKRRMRANMMLVLVTDERGDDFNLLESTVQRCAREGVKAYCIGNTSVFGREKGYIRTRWEADGEVFEEDLPADMGPETAMAEGVQVPFWTASARGLNRMSSGYGPYTLSRLCSETGGIFFIAEDTNRRKFDPMIMRKYLPDYRPERDYKKQLSSNSAKAALVTAGAKTLLENGDVPIPKRDFQANTDNILRQQITEAQKPLAVLDYYLTQLHQILEAGEKDRNKLDSDRWRASFDLAMGRVLAMRVRAFGYNAMLAEMKSSPKPFQKEGNNQWVLRPSDEINAGATVRKLHKKAQEYLTRVIDEHPGTPWQFLASVELNSKLGWAWHESKMQVAANNMGNGNNANNPQFAEEEERRREMRKRQQKKNASRPKL